MRWSSPSNQALPAGMGPCVFSKSRQSTSLAHSLTAQQRHAQTKRSPPTFRMAISSSAIINARFDTLVDTPELRNVRFILPTKIQCQSDILHAKFLKLLSKSAYSPLFSKLERPCILRKAFFQQMLKCDGVTWRAYR